MMNYRDYTLLHAATALGIIGLYHAVLALFDVNILTAFIPVLPSVVAAMWQGCGFAQVARRAPSKAEAWRFAVVATALSVGLLGLYCLILAAVHPVFLNALLLKIGPAILGPALLAFLCGVIFLTSRFMLTYNAGLTLKAAMKRASAKP